MQRNSITFKVKIIFNSKYLIFNLLYYFHTFSKKQKVLNFQSSQKLQTNEHGKAPKPNSEQEFS